MVQPEDWQSDASINLSKAVLNIKNKCRLNSQRGKSVRFRTREIQLPQEFLCDRIGCSERQHIHRYPVFYE